MKAKLGRNNDYLNLQSPIFHFKYLKECSSYAYHAHRYH